MTLIKGNSAIAKRAAAFRSPSVAAEVASARHQVAIQNDITAEAEDKQGAQVRALTDQVEALEAALRTAQDQNEIDRAEAFEQGREEGLAAAETREHERIAVLQGAVTEALATLERKVDQERDLAIDIARAALDRVVADPALYHGLVAETARRHAAGLQRGSIVGLRVSPIDFPDADALAALPQLGTHAKVEADPALEAGACIFDLSLGSFDVSIPRQLAAIEGALEQTYRKAVSA